MVYSDRQRQFGLNKRNSLTDQCKRCRYLFACHGECPKNRFIDGSGVYRVIQRLEIPAKEEPQLARPLKSLASCLSSVKR
ncbi:MAG: SPASM domain-containing protein [Thermoguttaceae bacterium]